jgi:hypothetical protein
MTDTNIDDSTFSLWGIELSGKYLESCSKEKLIELLRYNELQVIRANRTLSIINWGAEGYSQEDYGPYEPGKKVYYSAGRGDRHLQGTAVDHEKLSREQLLEAIFGTLKDRLRHFEDNAANKDLFDKLQTKAMVDTTKLIKRNVPNIITVGNELFRRKHLNEDDI